MKNRLFNYAYICMIAVMMFCSNFVSAAHASGIDGSGGGDNTSLTDCYITSKLAGELKGLIDVIKYLAVAALIVLTMLDILKIVLQPNKDEKVSGRPDIWKKIIIRAIAVCLIFFLTPIINTILGLFDIKPILCGII